MSGHAGVPQPFPALFSRRRGTDCGVGAISVFCLVFSGIAQSCEVPKVELWHQMKTAPTLVKEDKSNELHAVLAEN